MEINTKDKPRLETISEGNVLVFPDREEVVIRANSSEKCLITRRDIFTPSLKDIPFLKNVREFVTYNINKIKPNSSGEVTYGFL